MTIISVVPNKFTPSQWEAYYQFTQQILKTVPTAHLFLPPSLSKFQMMVSKRLERSPLDIFLIFEEAVCLGSVECLNIPNAPSTAPKYAYVTGLVVGKEADWQKAFQTIIEDIQTKQAASWIRVTSSQDGVQKLAVAAGGKLAIHDLIQVLPRTDVPTTTIQQYIEKGKDTIKQLGLRLEYFETPSEEMLGTYLEFHNTIVSDIIVYDMEHREQPIDKEMLHRKYAQLDRMGGKAYHFALINTEGKMVGLSEVSVEDIEDADEIQGGLTAVLKDYRRNQLALFLKSLVLDKMLELFPDFGSINTSNSAINTPILGLNKQLAYQRIGEEFIVDFKF